jgi:hypothetical protein
MYVIPRSVRRKDLGYKGYEPPEFGVNCCSRSSTHYNIYVTG